MSQAKHPGQVEITFSYTRHVGPRYVHGGLTLQFDSLRPYAFVSRAQWPAADNYDTSIREAVEQVLQERQGHTQSTLVVLGRVLITRRCPVLRAKRKCSARSEHYRF